MLTYNVIHAISELVPGACCLCAEREDGTYHYEDIDWQETEIQIPSREVVEAKVAELNAAEPLRYLREKRDELLAETDWWASSDRTMTAEQTAYRQALRDLPANTTDPENPVWPTKP